MNPYSNPVVIKIQGGGTVQGSVDLCASCRFCLRRRSAITGRQETRCDALPQCPVIRTQIAECNRYVEQGKLTLHEMVEVAWIVESRGKHIGFLSPEELERRRNRGNQGSTGSPVGF